MPPKRKFQGLVVPDWVTDLLRIDRCLYEVVMDALVARFSARSEETCDICLSKFRSADKMMGKIRKERVTGREAWLKAAKAMRKYTVAAECVHPTASRYSRKRRRK